MNRRILASALGLTAAVLAVSGVWVWAQDAAPAKAAEPAKAPEVKLVSSTPVAGALDPSLQNEVKAAMFKGLDWLAAQQKADGSWGDGNFPAITALAMQAFIKGQHPNKKHIVDQAAKYLVSCVQTNGGIYREVPGRKGGGLSNYNTAICMMALHDTGDEAHTKIVQAARKFVAGTQYMGDDTYKGGFGYDKSTDRAYTDLLNTYFVAEAMSKTAAVEDRRDKTEPRVDINWDETVKFVEQMQNKPGSGEEQAGGFFYNPSDPKAGVVTNQDGVVVFRSFGSMTYAGMLALIHAKVSRDDIRVKSAFEWSCKHWELDENPGMGGQGVYFFYNILSKSLAAYGRDMIQAKDGKLINWKAELGTRLVKLQNIDPASGKGFWVNKNNRFWEADPILVTAYTLAALENL